MKRKVWSLLLALALCLSLLPAAAFAEDGGSESGESTASVASVTIGDETTEYSNIFRAFESVKNASSATIRLLDDVYLPEDEDEGFKGSPGKIKFESFGSVTLDLNDHLLTQADIGFTDGYTPNVIEMLYGTLTITGKGTIYQRYKTSAISVSSQSELTIDGDGVTVKADFTYGSQQFKTDSSRAIAINGGTLEIRGGTFTATSGVALEYAEGTVLLSGGTFNGINILTYKYPGKINEGVTIVDLLAPGHTYRNTDGTALTDYYLQKISDVQVVKGLPPVPYVGENGETATATDYIQIEPDTKEWTGGTYVVRGDVTIDGDVTVTGKMPSIILCDRASLTVNGGITLPDGRPEALTIYGQTGGTGKMTVTNGSGAAFSCEGLAVLRLLNGTLTATGKDTAFSSGVMVWNQLSTGNDEIKCVATGSEPETWADGAAVPSVTISRCTEHQWSYERHKSEEQHLKTCVLCGYNPNGAGVYENCVYKTYYGANESGHKKACVCHRTEPGAELVKHTPKYIPNADGKTHGYRCEVCDFVSDATAIPHSYVGGVCSACGYACPHEGVDRTIGSETEGICGVCGERVYEARLVRDNGKVVEHYATVGVALARYTAVSDSIVTLLCDKDMGDGALVVTYEIAGKELDLGGHTLSGSGDAVFRINKQHGFTLHNGTVKNTGDGDAVQLIHGTDPSWGNMTSDGELTLENITVTAAKGWAIRVADDAYYADLYIKSGTFNGGLNAGTISGGHKVQISGGTFIANPDTHSIYYPGSSLTETMLVGRLKNMLEGGWTYGDADGKAINYFAAENRTIVGKSEYNYPKGVYLNAGTVTIVEHASHPIDRDTGKCSICGAPCTHIETDKDGICTACGVRVMFCETGGELYKTIQAAQETLKDRTDNPTVKLLADYVDNVSLLGTENGYTLDLNGFKLVQSPVIMLEGRTLTITDSSETKTGGLTELQISGGTAYLQGGSYAELAVSHGTIKVIGEGTVRITKKIEMPGKFIASGEYSNDLMVADMLTEGYAFYLVDENAGTETLVNGYRNVNGQTQQYLPGPNRYGAELSSGQYYTVKAHEHSYADSTVTTCKCGKTCTHDTVGADGKCAGCGKVFTASVTNNGKTVYYADGFYPNTGNTRSGLDVAFEKAEVGSTVTLLGGSSVTGYLDGGKTLALDLNGKNVESLYIGRVKGINALNITGSGDIGSLYVHADNTAILTGWTGKMELLYVYDGGEATLSAGTVVSFGESVGTAGSVLAAGRVFQREDGSLVEYGTALSELQNVTAAVCPDTVIENGHCIYCSKTVAAMVNGTAYNDFASAVTAWLASGGTMTLYQSVNKMTSATWQGGDGKTYTLDLNGCVLTAPDDDDSGSNAPAYQITVTNMDLTVQDSSADADGRIDNLVLSANTALTLKSGWLGKPTVPDDATVHVTLEGGGLKGYDVRVPLAYLLPDGYDLDGVSNLYHSGTSGLTVTVRKAPLTIGGEKQGTMPFGRNRLPFAPAAALDADADAPEKLTAAWYKRDGSFLADAGMKQTETGYVYDGASEKPGFEAYKDMTAGKEYDLFMVLTAADESGAMLWRAAVTGYELSVGLPTLDDAEIAFTGDSEAVFDPDGSTGVPAFTVKLYGKTVDAAHYTVSGSTADGVRTYTVTVTGDGENYVGSKSAQWTVRAHRLGGMELRSATRKYDGTTAVPDGVFTGIFRSAEDGASVRLAAGDYKITAESYNNANAGGGKTVTYTVELLNKNYTFENGKTAQFTAAAADLLKADAPEAAPVTLTVYNSQDKTYVIDLPALPTPPDGCEYGAAAYGEPVVAMTVSGYYSEGVQLRDGKLSLPIRENNVDTTGAIGTVQVTVTTANFEDITLTVNVVAANKIVPVPDSVSASAITYGEALSASTLTGAMQDGVQGDFAWTDSLCKPAAGSYEAEWKFTPTGSDAYKYAVTTGKVTVEVRKAAMSVTVEQYLTLTYDGTPQTADLTIVINTADKTTNPVLTYAAAEAGPYTATVPAFTDAGSYTVYFRATDPNGNHEPASGSFTVTIDPKTVTDPTIELRGDLTYTGEAIEPAVTVKDGETVIPADEYTVSFRGNVNAGTAAVTVADVAGGNYTVSGGATFEIAKAAQTFAAGPVAAVYGDTDARVTYTGTVYGAVTYAVRSGGDVAEVDETTGALTLLKSGTAVVTVTAAGDENHNSTSRDVAVTVQKAPLTIRALDRSAYTGSAAPDLSAPELDRDYVIEGLLDGDTVMVEDVRMSYDPEPDMTETGEYSILITGDLSADGRYEPDFASGMLTVEALPTYPVNVPDGTENGSVSVRPKRASRGDKVTITVEPDEGFALADLVVTDKDGNALPLTDKGGGKYAFTMPGGRVEVKASFKELVETSPFDDVKTDAYYYEAVKWAAENGIAAGIGNRLFGPDQPCTRAQIVTFLWRAAGSPEPNAESGFTDVPADSFYAKAVAWAVENGITNGTGEGKFSPDATCTRAQGVTFLFRAAEASADGAPAFTDVAADAYYAEAVKWAVDRSITNGIGNGLFDPNNACTREQIVTFLWRLYTEK